MAGLRVHVTGSAAAACDRALLEQAHGYVARLTEQLIARGHGLVVGFGGEPVGDAGMPCIFDWTALATVAAAADPAPAWPPLRAQRFVAVGSQRGLERVPGGRADAFARCRVRTDFELVVAPPGWRMAEIIREQQAIRGDVLVVIGGGAGGERLADVYRDDGKPVIALNADLGAYSEDGQGGGKALHARALNEPTHYFRLQNGTGDAAGRLAGLRLDTDNNIDALAAATADLIEDLRPPTAFYVRLLDTAQPEYSAVERFFREVVDPVVTERGFTPREMGRERPEAAFMNVEIFAAIHRAGLVVVDLTAVRPNCTMELGYALGRRRRFVISARAGTKLPFDEDKLPTFPWDDAVGVDLQREAYRDWLDHYSELPPIIA